MELITTTLMHEQTNFFCFAIAFYYFNKLHNESKLDTRVLLGSAWNEYSNNVSNKQEILMKLVTDCNLNDYKFHRLLIKTQKQQMEFICFIFENYVSKKEITIVY